MRPRTIVLPALLLLAAAASGVTVADTGSGAAVECSFPFSSTDATGSEVTVPEAPDRVVTLGPSAAQTMWEIGGKDKVVGVSKYAAYLEGASAKTNVSGSGQTFVVAEKVIDLEPDLVLAPNIITNGTVEQLRNAGLTVYRVEAAGTIADVTAKTLLIGELTGECEGATETVARMDSRLETVREAVSGQDNPRVLYTFFGYTAGSGTFIHEIITTAGGENVAATAGIEGYGQLNQEVVVEENPEWIVLNRGAPTVPKTAAYNGTYAVQHDQVVVVDENYISQPGPRIIQPVVTLAKAFHPEAYAAANATPTPTPTPTATTRAPITDSPTGTTQPTTTESDGQPGFGVLAVLVAAVLVSLITRRR